MMAQCVCVCACVYMQMEYLGHHMFLGKIKKTMQILLAYLKYEKNNEKQENKGQRSRRRPREPDRRQLQLQLLTGGFALDKA